MDTIETTTPEIRQITFEDALAVFDEKPNKVEQLRDINEPEKVFK